MEIDFFKNQGKLKDKKLKENAKSIKRLLIILSSLYFLIIRHLHLSIIQSSLYLPLPIIQALLYLYNLSYHDYSIEVIIKYIIEYIELDSHTLLYKLSLLLLFIAFVEHIYKKIASNIMEDMSTLIIISLIAAIVEVEINSKQSIFIVSSAGVLILYSYLTICQEETELKNNFKKTYEPSWINLGVLGIIAKEVKCCYALLKIIDHYC